MKFKIKLSHYLFTKGPKGRIGSKSQNLNPRLFFCHSVFFVYRLIRLGHVAWPQAAQTARTFPPLTQAGLLNANCM